MRWPWKPKLGLRLRLPPPDVRAIQRSAALPVHANGRQPSPTMRMFREFLNSDEGSAFVSVSSEDIKLADCDRVVTLDFGIWSETPEQLAENLRLRQEKLNRIIRAVRVASDNLAMSYNWNLRRLEDEARREEAKRGREEPRR